MRPPIATVSIENLRYNAKEIKKLCGKSKFCAVVKSNAYGHGTVGCARILEDIADCFAVSLLSEGMQLRFAGIEKPVYMLLPPSKEEISPLIRYGITITVDSVKRLNEVKNVAISMCKTAQIAIAVNSGMNRLGIDTLEELDSIISTCGKFEKHLKITDIFSHFANVYDLELTQKQYEKFMLFSNRIKSKMNVTSHISASGGLILGKYNLDMVRIGIMLYGYLPFPTDKIALKKVMTIKAGIIKNRDLCEGESLLYGDYKLKNNRRVSIINYGYSDCGKRKFMHGSINNLCMDMSASVSGGMVLNDAEEIAKQNGTISYEVLAMSTARCEIIYK